MSLTPIYDDLMRELDGIMEASKAKEAESDEKAVEQKLDGQIAG
jgi:hypothetical protein